MQCARRCFVTGASGFIGTHVVRHMQRRGYSIRGLARSSLSHEKLKQLDVEPYSVELSDVDGLTRAVAGCELVVHLAGITQGARPAEFNRVNRDGTAALIKACARQTTPPVFVLVSSLAAVGPAATNLHVSEATDPRPRSAYGRSKLAAEFVLRGYAAQVPASILRPPIVLGEHDMVGLQLFRSVANWSLHLVPTWQWYRVSVIHADDVAAALILVAEHGKRLDSSGENPEQGVYFASAEVVPTYSELGRMIARSVGRRRILIVPVAWPVLRLVAGLNDLRWRWTGNSSILSWDKCSEAVVGPWTCSAEKIRNELGFKVAAPLQQRLDQTALWYERHGCLRPSAKNRQDEIAFD
jgi:nucleoside-diphosphate-sugar epimerase